MQLREVSLKTGLARALIQINILLAKRRHDVLLKTVLARALIQIDILLAKRSHDVKGTVPPEMCAS
jgi:hypothetical protein